MEQHFARLLEEIAKDPDRSIWELPMLTDDERQKQLCRCQRHGSGLRAGAVLPRGVRGAGREHAGCGGGRVWRRVALLRGAQRARQSARRTTCAGWARRRTSWSASASSVRSTCWWALLGIMKSGAAYVPLDPAYPNDRLAFIMEDAGIELLVTQESLRSSCRSRCRSWCGSTRQERDREAERRTIQSAQPVRIASRM